MTVPAFFALTDARAATCAHCGNHAWLPPESDRSESSRRLGAWCSSACAAALDYLEAVRAHDVADTTETFLVMCAAGASLTGEERDAAHALSTQGACEQNRYANLRAAKVARAEAHGGECFGVCCLGRATVPLA